MSAISHPTIVIKYGVKSGAKPAEADIEIRYPCGKDGYILPRYASEEKWIFGERLYAWGGKSDKDATYRYFRTRLSAKDWQELASQIDVVENEVIAILLFTARQYDALRSSQPTDSIKELVF